MNRLDIFTMMREGMTAEEAIEKAFSELMTLITELKAENKVNARNYQDSRREAAEYREQWLKAEESVNKLIAKNAYLTGVIEQRNAELKRGRDDFMQALTDPENQPSQWGTVTLEMYESLELKLYLLRALNNVKKSSSKNAKGWVTYNVPAELDAAVKAAMPEAAHGIGQKDGGRG